ncbi:TIGR04282 family arsenosugar biosynthesis glycosyltransferase [Solidesulfovibrio sp.]
MNRTALLVMVKAPLPGQVKTRLAAAIGDAAALAAYRAMVATVLAAADASGLPLTIVFTPAEALETVTGLCGPGRRYQPQAGGDLGARMDAALARALADGADAALLVGSDLPLLTGDRLRQAAAALENTPAVLGPAADGGYYLIGFTRAGYRPEVFRDIPWSTPAVADLTLARLRAAAPADSGDAAAVLPELPDCDEGADLARLAGPPWRKHLAGTPFGEFLAGLTDAAFDHNPGCRLFVGKI